MEHRDFLPYDGKRVLVTFADGSQLEGPLLVFDLTGGYKNMIISTGSKPEWRDVSFEPEEATAIEMSESVA